MKDDCNDLNALCSKVRTYLRADIEKLEDFIWFGSLQPRLYDLMKRSMVVRQWEACEAIQSLIETGHGAMCCTLLRPAYEELLWLLYLEKNKEFSVDLVRLIARKEISDSHNAQKKFLGEAAIRKMGFTPKKIRSLNQIRKPTYRELRELGAQLGWKEGQSMPSVSFIAKEVGRTSEYEYLYQATSRSVHFSAHELQRRVWGQPGSVKISSNTFKRYWGDFGSYWSTKILLETMVVSNLLNELFETDQSRSDDFIKDLHKLRSVQILTATELDWWDSPKKTAETKFGSLQ